MEGEPLSGPVAAERPKRRRRNAAANDELLDQVSLDLISQHGVDGLSFSEISEKTGLSRAPIYARFDSPEDVAVDLWSKTLLSHLDHLLSLNAAWYSGSETQPSAELLQELSAPSTKSNSLVEVLAVARRFPYLQDVVARDFSLRIENYVEQSKVPRAAAVTQMSVLLGTLFLAPIFNSVVSVLTPVISEGWKDALPIAREILGSENTWSVEPIVVTPIELPLPVTEFNDELLNAFVPATMTVISRSGYEHASANRISREAGRAFNAVYEKFPNKEALMERVVSAWVEDGVNTSFTPFLGITEDEFIVRSVTQGRSLVAEINRPFRNLRNEMTLAARHHQNIAEDMVELYARAAQNGYDASALTFSGSKTNLFQELGRLGSLVRSNGSGLCLMGSCVGTLADIDWTPASTKYVESLYRRVIAKLTPSSS
jgi:AcrR family transcriptional regulator